MIWSSVARLYALTNFAILIFYIKNYLVKTFMAITNAVENRNVRGYLQELAKELKASYIEYSDNTIIITIPLQKGRFQGVKVLIAEKKGEMMLTFTSSVCRLSEYDNIDFKHLLEMNYELCYTKIAIIEAEFVELVASVQYDVCTDEQLRNMVIEAATVADELELKLTGKDVY
ncbi:hypothetical protein M23134_04192 [Microscilla marina ATCC 23134]|uniref:YbjN domain-containing protein n=2 Tax=Microscilla marina TaxID=1027 RepID=A1ZE51_MICM2|nr:hypothetical protein M23134_04192 [Microscilla marina ATCC 23134]